MLKHIELIITFFTALGSAWNTTNGSISTLLLQVSLVAVLAKCNGVYLGLGKTSKALLITSTFSDITSNFEYYPMS